jgi:hypothetical protein
VELTADKFDLVWVHHQQIPVSLLESLESSASTPFFLFHHMSPYEALETPFLRDLENSLASVVLANSYETADTLKNLLSTGNIRVLGNPAPNNFFDNRVTEPKTQLKNILVVSNHVPQELPKALSMLLEDKSVTKVDYIGVGAKHRLLTPEILSRYDLVITIGKTVQYALAVGVPVYIYDRFGGPGFLTKKNFSTAFWYNFSGRGFKDVRLSPRQLYLDIKKNYHSRAMEFYDLQSEFSDLFSLEKNLVSILGELDRPRYKDLTGDKLWVAEQFVTLLAREVNTRYADHDYHVRLRESDKKVLEGYISDIQNYAKELEENLKRLQQANDRQAKILKSRTFTLLMRSKKIVRRLGSWSNIL